MEKITIETTVAQSIQKVWDCYTQPAHITQWNFADPSWHCPSAENDMKVGGKYKARMEAKDGSFGFDFEAIYSAIESLKSFTYKLDDGREVITKFENEGEKTKVVITFDPESENPVDMQEQGWQAILNNFKRYAENIN